ncbi:MAG: alpha-xylosidase [Beduini sp.]|uniref:alpha-xylosidase n=1 Tax=Beduini sp. TaxID=1922300 RepID=UPI0011CC67C7
MKFTDGYWMLKEGTVHSNAIEIYDYQIKGKTLVLYAPFKSIQTKGDTLNMGMLSIELDSPIEDVIGVKAYHHIGGLPNQPQFQLNETEHEIIIDEKDDCLIYTSGKAQAVIKTIKGKYELSFYYDGQLKTESLFKSLGYVETNGTAYMKEELTIAHNEYVYGLGERFTPFIKNGQVVDIYNKDGGTGSEQSYKNIPFYITNQSYGIFVNTPGLVSFEVASEKVSKVQFSTEGEVLHYYFIGGQDMKDVLVHYTSLTGKPSLPPAWSFGLWLSTSFLTDYDEATVNEFIDGMLERDIPLDVFHFDCCWMDEFEWCNFKWNPKTFPDPEKMLKRIHDKGVKICVWINPYIGQKSPLFKEGMENGYLLKRADGSVWQWDMWQAGMGLVDFTNPKAARWYLSYLEKLIDMGVDSFKTDFGERIPTDVVYYDHSDPKLMHNYYTHLYNEAVFNLLKNKRGEHEACLFARSATVGGQQFPVHWGGDCVSVYASMAESLRGGLSFTLSGFGYWSHDIGGFEDGCSPDLYKRWSQFGLLSTHSRYHGSGEYKVPWQYGEEAVAVTRQFTKLKLSLMPYLYTQSVKTHQTGIPMMRAMVLEFLEDRTTHSLDNQYMLGDQLLVAPILQENGEVEYYLPKGIWTNILTNKEYEGGNWIKETHGYDSLPLMVRENTILVTSENQCSAQYDYLSDVMIKLYHILPNQTLCQFVYGDDGRMGKVNVVSQEKEMTITLDGFNGDNKICYQGEEYLLSDHKITVKL